MPRAYTDVEQQRIRADLVREGLERFTAAGLAKVTVADLTGAVGIGKGSFYLFFGSKEELFLAVMEQEEERRERLIDGLLAPIEATGDGRAVLERFFTALGDLLDAHPFFRRLLDPDTIRRLTRAVPPDRLEAHIDGDRRWVGRLVARWTAAGLVRDLDPELVLALAASQLALALQRDLVGPEHARASATIARGVARELTSG